MRRLLRNGRQVATKRLGDRTANKALQASYVMNPQRLANGFIDSIIFGKYEPADVSGLYCPFPARFLRMTEATLAFSDPDEILRLFGAQDRYLRQVRDLVGVEVTLRGDEIRLHGTDDQIKRGLAIF